VRLDVQRVDLAAVVKTAVDTLKPTAEAKGVRLQLVLDGLAGPLSGDPNRLQQIFWNLLTNAVKFTPRGGRVQVILERIDSHLEVRVVDTGEGIAPDFLPHVFDRFRQFDASTTRRHGGLGLGLSIVKQLVELHGGSVDAKSAGLGQGATFTVMLPLSALHTSDAQSPIERRRALAGAGAGDGPVDGNDRGELTGLKILVVDDEPDARMLIKRLLEDHRAVVNVAASASEAFEMLRAAPPDVLISDVGMPGEDGYSLIRRIRALPPAEGGAVPAVALTAYARPEDRRNAVMAGFQHHVTKPAEPAELITMVASLTRQVS
jgi:CheY-like chemotaxis protein/two-component sensor histidine kinase